MRFIAISDSAFWGYPLTVQIAEYLRGIDEIETIEFNQVTVGSPICDLSGEKTVIHSFLHLPSIERFRRQRRTEKAWRNLRVFLKILRVLVSRQPTIVYVTTNRALDWTLKLKSLLRSNTKILLHYYEVWEPGEYATNRLKSIKRRIDKIDWIFVPELHRKMDLLRHFPSLEPKVILLPNSSNLKALSTRSNDRRISMLHVGAVGESSYWRELIAAIGGSNIPIDLVFVGKVNEQIMDYASATCPGIVKFVGEVSHSDLESHYRLCDIGVILYRGDTNNLEFAAPNKLYEYWSYGIPVLAHPLKGLQSQFFDECQGRLVDFLDPKLLQYAIEDLMKSVMDHSKRERLHDLFYRSLRSDKLIADAMTQVIASFEMCSNA